MANEAPSSSSVPPVGEDREDFVHGSESGWVLRWEKIERISYTGRSRAGSKPAPVATTWPPLCLRISHISPPQILTVAGATTPMRIGYVNAARMFFVAVLSTGTCLSIIRRQPLIVWLLATVICPFGVSPVMHIWMLK